MQVIPEEEEKYKPAEEETVAGQMGGLLSSGSSYLEAAKTRGEQFANRRGLLNTSMAAGATEAEAIKAALPIAQQDAGYMQSRGLEAQKGDIQSGLYKTQGRISGGLLAQEGTQAKELSKLGYTQEAGLAAQKGEIQTGLTELEAGKRSELSAQEATQATEIENIQQVGANYRLGLENDIKMQLAGVELASQERTALGEAMTEMGKQFEDNLSNVQRDPNVKSENKTSVIESIQRAYQADLTSLSNIYGVEISWVIVV